MRQREVASIFSQGHKNLQSQQDSSSWTVQTGKENQHKQIPNSSHHSLSILPENLPGMNWPDQPSSCPQRPTSTPGRLDGPCHFWWMNEGKRWMLTDKSPLRLIIKQLCYVNVSTPNMVTIFQFILESTIISRKVFKFDKSVIQFNSIYVFFQILAPVEIVLIFGTLFLDQWGCKLCKYQFEWPSYLTTAKQ